MPIRLTHDLLDERPIAGGRQLTLRVGAAGDAERVPALLLLPDAAAATTSSATVPAAVLLHGYSSRKEDMADLVGRGLLRRGIAALAIDLPLHGERRQAGATGTIDFRSVRNPIAVTQAWRRALADARLALGYLGARREVDAARLALVGYSMGSFLAVQVAADVAAVRALVLAAGGDLPEGTPFDRLVRAVADPLRAVRRYAGRPLLMVHGRRDHTVRPEQAERLFAAAGEPKTLRWYDAGHYLPASVADDAAAWLDGALRPSSPPIERDPARR